MEKNKMKNIINIPTWQKFSAVLFSLALFLFSTVNVALAKDVALAWDASQQSDVAGYKIYYGTSSGIYTSTEAVEGRSPIDIGIMTTASFVGLDDTKAHYFVVSAYNFDGEESVPTQEVNMPPKTANDLDGDGYDLTVDCDDYDAAINPGATEITGNGIDENCNGMADDEPTGSPAGAIEAESGSLTAPMQIIADNAAAGGRYIQTNTFSAGSAVYNFNVPTAGLYKFLAKTMALDGTSDSFFFNIDGASDVRWNVPGAYNVWSESEVTTLELTAGAHTISFKGRETNTRLDYFYMVKVGDVTVATDADKDGYDVNSDCNDNNPAINPGAQEITYNGIDENCNGMTDDNDLDHDGYSFAQECNDQDASINPGVTEITYNGIDENCNGMTDDDDLDHDGYSFAQECNDQDASINPGVTEIPGNGIDENCNGMTDDTGADNAAPIIDTISPVDGTSLKGRWATIQIKAIDDVMVMKTEVYLDGQLVLEEPGAIAQVQWDLKTASKGNHIIMAKAHDQAGNIGTRSITVVK